MACGDNFTVVIAEVQGDPMQKEVRTITAADLEKGGQIKALGD